MMGNPFPQGFAGSNPARSTKSSITIRFDQFAGSYEKVITYVLLPDPFNPIYSVKVLVVRVYFANFIMLQ
jgi:hypothetical protein